MTEPASPPPGTPSGSGRSSTRFGRLFERADGADFPFYDGDPVRLAPWKWWVVIAAAAAGFAALALIPVGNQVGLLGTRVLFVAIPLTVFIAVTGRFWRSVLRPLRPVDFLTMIVFWLLNLSVSAAVSLLIGGLDPGHLVANRATDGLNSPIEIALFYVGTAIQLFGEELFTILPFLAVLALSYRYLPFGRKGSIVVAWLLTALWFGAAHLPTYDWNVLQALVVIGVARIVLTLAFIRTKNVAVSFGAHLLNDWATFTAVLVFAR